MPRPRRRTGWRDLCLVLEGNCRQFGWQPEHDMKICQRHQISRTRGKPRIAGTALALGAMLIAANIVSNAAVRAIPATFDMAAKCSSPAECNDRHHPAFDVSEMNIMGDTVGRAMVAEDIRHLECGAHVLQLTLVARPQGLNGRAGFASQESSSWPHGCCVS